MAMDSSKLSALLFLLMLSISSTTTTLACGTCPTPPAAKPPKRATPPAAKPPKGVPILPPIIGKPPITVPPITIPPVIGKPPITVPPVIGQPPITVPPVIIVPPIIGGTPPTTKPGCPTPAKPETCPIDTLKLFACVDLLGGLTKIHIGDPAVNECCPVISGLSGFEAALCLCTTIKEKVLNVNVYFPIALQVLITCGNTPPPGYTCP